MAEDGSRIVFPVHREEVRALDRGVAADHHGLRRRAAHGHRGVPEVRAWHGARARQRARGLDARRQRRPSLRHVISPYQPGEPLPYRGYMTAWSHLPPALPPHGTVLAWARGCRCDECEDEYKRFRYELALQGPVRFPAEPEPPKMDADTLAR